jgi:three-Cys-motif partner protein
MERVSDHLRVGCGRMSKAPKERTVGPWAIDKLDALRKCLEYYTTRLKKQTQWEKIYVDAFAGPGLSVVRTRPRELDLQQATLFGDAGSDPVEQEEVYLKGSPRVALEITNPFDRYVFIEKDSERVSELQTLKEEYRGTRVIEVKQGDANAILEEVMPTFNRSRNRGYVFLDPFGVQVSWTTIERIARTQAVEVFINFPLGMALRRMMPNSGNVPDGWNITLDAFFGTPDWIEHVYFEASDLVGESLKKHEDAQNRILTWCCGRLKEKFGHVSEPMLVTNTRGGHLYYLIWAGPHEAGLKGANYILTTSKSLPKSRR